MTSLHEQYYKLPKEDRPRPKIEECIPRRLYRVGARSIREFAVYNGEGGFIGIREKFGHDYLSTELHWDKCTSFGTVHTVIDTGVDLPEDIELRELVDLDNHTISTYKPLLNWLMERGSQQE